MDCVFCDIATGRIEADVVGRDEAGVAFLDLSPKSPGHTLVIPRRHVVDLADDATALVEIMPLVAQLSGTLLSRLGADGITVQVNSGVSAGQEVFHLHLHLVPRYGRTQAPPSRDAVREALADHARG